MANPVDFSVRLTTDFVGKTDEQKIDYLTTLFLDLMDEPEIIKEYPVAKAPLSDRTFKQAGKRAFDFLSVLSQVDRGWDNCWLKTMLENALSYLERIDQNTKTLRYLIESGKASVAEFQRLISDGVDLNGAQLFRLLFENQSSETVEMVQALCNMKYFPTEQNLCHLIAVDSQWTYTILQSFRPYREVTFSNACLGAALRYSTTDQSQIIRFLGQQKIEPTEQQIQFAHVHGTPSIRKSLKLACRTVPYKECHDGRKFFVKSGNKDVSFNSIIDAILEQSDLSIAYILQYLAKGSELQQEHLNYLIQRPMTQKDHTFEILRIYLMNGLAFSEVQWKFVIQGNISGFISDLNLARYIRVHQVYGHTLTDKIQAALKARKKGVGSSTAIDPVIKALEFSKDRPYICRSQKSLKSLANRYIHRAPWLFELLISSGIQPSESHIKDFFSVPRDSFFKSLLNDAYFEANSYNQDLLDQVIVMATGDIVKELVNRGFVVGLTHILKSFETQRAETTTFLINHFKETCDLHEPIKFDVDSSIWNCFSYQSLYSYRILKDRLEDGDILERKQIDFLKKNPTQFTPEVLLEIERSGISVS